MSNRGWKILDDRKERTTHLKVKRAKDDRIEDLGIRPVDSQRTLEYEQWLRNNRERLHKISDNRVAYL